MSPMCVVQRYAGSFTPKTGNIEWVSIVVSCMLGAMYHQTDPFQQLLPKTSLIPGVGVPQRHIRSWIFDSSVSSTMYDIVLRTSCSGLTGDS